MDSFHLRKITSLNYKYYLGFTLPEYYEALKRVDAKKDFYAVGLDHSFIPIGLALMLVRNNHAKILSIYVDHEYRKRGLGTKLYNDLESHCKKNAVKKLYFSYSSSSPFKSFVERFSTKFNFTENENFIRMIRYTISDIRRDSTAKRHWINALYPKGSIELFHLKDMTRQDHIDYKKLIDEENVPYDVHMDFNDFPMEPTTSVGLKKDGKLIGWLSTHRVQKDLIRYTSLYLSKKISQNYSVYMIAEALRNHRVLEGDPDVLQLIPKKFGNMQKLTTGKLFPHSYKEDFSITLEKLLS